MRFWVLVLDLGMVTAVGSPITHLGSSPAQVVADIDGGAAGAALTSGNSGLAKRLAAAARLEAATVEQTYGAIKSAEAHLKQAEAALGLDVELTGTYPAELSL